ncbi:MAG: GerMN domain-containing protein [Treponema sp.]|jgi:hypothetical protein|nr:GerMN domain-containing protein [Treponema sp.]
MRPAAQSNRKKFYQVILGGSLWRFALLCLLGLFAYRDYAGSAHIRRTFVFYARSSGRPVLEERMLYRSGSPELDISRYIQEALLGPAVPETAPLFPRETRLNALIFQEGAVYADFSADAALPPHEGGDALQNFASLNRGIRRNFPFVEDVRFFISGREAYRDKFTKNFLENTAKAFKSAWTGG